MRRWLYTPIIIWQGDWIPRDKRVCQHVCLTFSEGCQDVIQAQVGFFFGGGGKKSLWLERMVGKKNQVLFTFWRLPHKQPESKHARAKRHALLETKQVMAPVPLSTTTVVYYKMDGVWGAEWRVAKATTVYRYSISKLLFGCLCPT